MFIAHNFKDSFMLIANYGAHDYPNGKSSSYVRHTQLYKHDPRL
jgi:hypothetical protein